MQEKRSFFIIWIGQMISSIGSGLTAFSLGIYAFQKTQTATNYSLIILFSFLPSFILKPIGGTFADRMNRRLLMIIGDAGSAIGLVFIFIMFINGMDSMWVIYSGVAVSSIFVAIQNPAYKASITDLLDEDSYSNSYRTNDSGIFRFKNIRYYADFISNWYAFQQFYSWCI